MLYNKGTLPNTDKETNVSKVKVLAVGAVPQKLLDGSDCSHDVDGKRHRMELGCLLGFDAGMVPVHGVE